jgi:hypothetical protein
MNDVRDKLIELVKRKGPCLPSDVYKEIGTNQLFASAMLGELVSAGTVKVTFLKRGSSPYYYLDDQKDRLQPLSQYLNEKDRMVYNLLREKQILKDSEQIPLTRVALRAIKDYAVPLNITYDSKTELFWKWYLLSNAEAEIKIKRILGILPPEETKKEEKHEEQKKILPKEIKPELKKEQAPEQKIETIKKEVIKPIQEIKTPFFDLITKYFAKNNIIILNHESTNKTKTEFDFIIELPSPVGKLQYYCKAKDKKKINDGDIASAYVQGQQKRLPTLVLINGEITKKTQEMLNKEFKGITVAKI